MDNSNIPPHLPVQHQIRELFLQRAMSVADWNARALFLELIHIPTADDIKIYCQGKFVERWKLRPQYGGFYKHCEATGRTDYSTVHSKAEVRDAYLKLVEGLTKRVSAFGENGKNRLLAIAAAPGIEEEQRTLVMLDIRSLERIPTKEPVAVDEDGRVVCEYRCCRVFRGERALLDAAGLV